MTTPDESVASVVGRKLFWRLVPFLFLLYVVAYLDRINVGFAALQMKHDLGFSDAVYGLAAGVFFAGYFIFQVPSNLLLERYGARVWICTLMIVWGIISSSMSLVKTPHQFYALRFALGLAEAGFFPGMILYLKRWFPLEARARTIAWFMTAGPISAVIGGPLSGAILGLHFLKNVRGWQWLFLMEGMPAIALGFVVLFYLTDNPGQATWLSANEKSWLIDKLKSEAALAEVSSTSTIAAAFVNPNVWILSFVYLGLNICSYGMNFWFPTLIRSLSGVSDFAIGILSAIPYVAAAVLMVVSGRHSDRGGERRWHVAVPAFAGAIAFAAAANTSSLVPMIVAISFAVVGVNAMIGPFWAMPTTLLSGTAAASGIAFVNSIGNLGGFLGPYVIGRVKTSTGGFRGGLLIAAASLLVSAALALAVRMPRKTTA